jgi:hypothetical protein
MNAQTFPNGMDFMKQFWQQGAASTMPNAAASASTSASPAFAQAMGQYMLPTFDLDELDKRIADMRTVLQFMELNTNLLRQSLSTLEVQRNTLATLQSMAKPASPATDDAATDAASATPWLSAWQSMMHAASQGAASAPPAATSAAKKTAAKRKAAPAKKAAPRAPASKK